MADCSFTIPFGQDASVLLNKIRSAIEKQGGTFDGDSTSGTFSVKVMGTISGSYTIGGNNLTVTISSKPMFISCGQIESFMRAQFIS
jgi:hypothetical protein